MLITADGYLETINVASVENNQMPDAYILAHESLEMAYMAGVASEISDPYEVCNEAYFADGALNAITYKGKKVGYPFSYNTCALVYNDKYLRDWAQQKALDILNGDTDKYSEGEYFSEMETTVEDADQNEWVTPDPEETEIYEIDPDLVPYKDLNDTEKETVLANKTEEVYATAMPETLYDLLGIADTYDVPNGVTGVMSWDVSDILYNYWIVGGVMNLGGPSGDSKELLVFDNDETVNCLKRYSYLHNFFSIQADAVDYGSVVQDFIDGKMLFTIGSVDIIATLEQAKAEERMDFDYGITLIPDVSDEIESRPLALTNAIVVNGYSEKKDIANAFASYLVTDFASELYTRTGKASCNKMVNLQNEYLKVFDEEYARSVPLPKIIELENFWMELEALFSRIWSGEDIQIQLKDLEETVSHFFG